MKRFLHGIGFSLLTAMLFSLSFEAKAQDPPPSGGFKNAYLTLNKSGKVVLTYTLWDQQVTKGNYTLAFFWASWSDEAREEVPYVQAIYKKYAGKVKVLGVTYGDEIQDSMDAIPEWGMTFPHFVFVEDAEPDGRFDIDSIPLVILFGPDGNIIARDMKGEEIEKAVEEALK
ncbi:MAG: TlpA family protein disulfide reductase [Bacteroidales bacterium]|nr:TlpA family protein disulfide reductase [Fibrobacter sp.]MBR3387248.1 TlpA family protein disulfide reductase [Bacteroidales bacterium]